MASDLQLVAHRGLSARAPENTLPACELAWREGHTAVEVDLRLSADGVLHLCHDEDLMRCCGFPARVNELDARALSLLDAGSWFAEGFRNTRLPTLEDLLRARPPKTQLLLELKEGPEQIPPLAAALNRHGLLPGDYLLLSFHASSLIAAQQALPGCRCLWLAAAEEWAVPGGLARLAIGARQQRFAGLNLGHRAGLSIEEVRRVCRDYQLLLGFWTVDEPAQARALALPGVSYLTSNDPTALVDCIT